MKITEVFIEEILKKEYPNNYQRIYDDSPMLQYLDKKMKAVHGNSKTRRSLANIYAVYSILNFYQEDFYEKKKQYCKFKGYDYMKLFNYYRGLYGGNKLQNHALNSRVNGEFHNKIKSAVNDLIIINPTILEKQIELNSIKELVFKEGNITIKDQKLILGGQSIVIVRI